MSSYVVFDLDGCLFDDTHRHSLARNKQWDDYNCEHIRDIPRHREYALKVAERYQIIYCTGRNERHRKTTVAQLYDCGFPEGTLLMRPLDDYRRAGEMKIFLLNQMFGDKLGEEVFVAFDNEDDVLEHYTKAGIYAVKLKANGPSPDEINAPVPCQPVSAASSPPRGFDVPSILRDAADIYTERNPIYGNNYQHFAPVLEAMFPNGIKPEMFHSNEFGIYMMMLVKMTRLVQGDKINHLDSARDIMVYAAMLSELIYKEIEECA